MRVGMGAALMNARQRSDVEIYCDALSLIEQAEPMGFDSVWTVEHHFTGHSPVPDPLLFLAYVAGMTRRIRLGSAVLVLPWHDPVRVAEQIAMLDILSEGRTSIGFGKGASEVEYAGFCVDRREAFGRFLEGFSYVRDLLTDEHVAHAGEFYKRESLTIRPRPAHSPEESFYIAAHSAESGSLAGELGAGLLFSPELRRPEKTHELLSAYRFSFSGAGQPRTGVHMYVCLAESEDAAQSLARTYMTPMVKSLSEHYSSPPSQIASPLSVLLSDNFEEATTTFISRHLVGDPESAIKIISEIHAQFGIDLFIGEFMFGDMPRSVANTNLNLFHEQVMPSLKAL